MEASELSVEFSFIEEIYERAADGSSLVELMANDWRFFPTGQIAPAQAAAILGEILSQPDIAEERFRPVVTSGPDHLSGWTSLREELMQRNRFFPETEFSSSRTSDLLAAGLMLEPVDIAAKWHRARVEKEGRPYSTNEMSAPPPDLAGHGRANPAGIPYLYLSSSPKVAVAEIPPYPGEKISVAEFTVDPATLSLIDLRDPRGSVSPFMVEDVSRLRADLGFLEALGNELRAPVTPNAMAIRYIPSQYLCEFIKRDGYDGVVYGSTVADGVNLALFYPEKATGGAVTEYVVTKVDISMEQAPPKA